jgi:hypothetical protein
VATIANSETAAADGVGGVSNGPVEVELDGAPGELVGDRARVGQRAGEVVERGHHERVSPLCRALAVGAGQAVVDVT